MLGDRSKTSIASNMKHWNHIAKGALRRGDGFSPRRPLKKTQSKCMYARNHLPNTSMIRNVDDITEIRTYKVRIHKSKL